MNPMTIDMHEVTRLTRAGQLAEAMAMLRGKPASPPAGASATPRREPCQPRPREALDMVPPTRPDGAWTVPRPAAAGDATNAASARPATPDAMREFAARLGRRGPRSMPGRTPGSPRGRVEMPVPPGARFEWRTFASAIGSRDYKLYVPSAYRSVPLPLVVMLHGCTQLPDDFAAGTRMNEVAEEQGFLVAYPAQTKAANAAKCWNWFSAGDQRRDAGEPALIAGMTRRIMADFAVDPERVYVAGLSAGGAAAAVMASAYADLYAAVGVHSGLPCGAARDMPSAFEAMRQGAPPLAAGRHGQRPMPTIVFHGDRDTTVNPVNGDQVIAQSQGGAELRTTTTEGIAAGGQPFTRTVHTDADGRPILEQWLLHGARHAWSGGSAAGSYTDPRGPDASREMMRFFAQHRRRGGGA